ATTLGISNNSLSRATRSIERNESPGAGVRYSRGWGIIYGFFPRLRDRNGKLLSRCQLRKPSRARGRPERVRGWVACLAVALAKAGALEPTGFEPFCH